MFLILGTTASGKGRLAFELAKSSDAEIISIDSMKVYRRMDIGTAKPPIQDREQIRYHLVDIIEPTDSYSVGAFYEDVLHSIKDITSRGKKIIAVGGTALYIKALLHGLFEGPGSDEQVRAQLQERLKAEGPAELHRQLAAIDPVAAGRINPNDSKRIIRALEVFTITGKPISSYQKQWQTHDTQSIKKQPNHNWTIIGLHRQRTDTSNRINQRVKKMIVAGLIDEVKSLLEEEKPLSKQAQCAIGYAEIIQYLKDRIDLKSATELMKKNTRRLAKGQRTWFKTFRNIHWLDVGPEESGEEILYRTKQLLSNITA